MFASPVWQDSSPSSPLPLRLPKDDHRRVSHLVDTTSARSPSETMSGGVLGLMPGWLGVFYLFGVFLLSFGGEVVGL